MDEQMNKQLNNKLNKHPYQVEWHHETATVSSTYEMALDTLNG
jgi:hypothetical protein